MPDFYLQKMLDISQKISSNTDFSLQKDLLAQNLKIINNQTFESFAKLTPIEFLSMMHYQVAVVCVLYGSQADTLILELETLVPFLKAARFYFQDSITHAEKVALEQVHHVLITAYQETCMPDDVEIVFSDLEGKEAWADSLYAYIDEYLSKPAPAFSVYLLLKVLSNYLECLSGPEAFEFNHHIALDLSAANVLSTLSQHPLCTLKEKNTFARAIIKLLESTEQPPLNLKLSANDSIAVPDSAWLFAKGIKDKSPQSFSDRYQTYDLLAQAYFQLAQYKECATTVEKAAKIYDSQTALVLNDVYLKDLFKSDQKHLLALRKSCSRRLRPAKAPIASQLSSTTPKKKKAARASKSLRHEKSAAQHPASSTKIMPRAKLEQVMKHKNRRFKTPLSSKERDAAYAKASAICFQFNGFRPVLADTTDSTMEQAPSWRGAKRP